MRQMMRLAVTFATLWACLTAAEPSWCRTTLDAHALPQHDQRDWSQKRREAYQHAHATGLGEPLAILHIPSLELSVPVYGDTERRTLDGGAGWVAGTASPGSAGNTAIAGHRDGFFRPLRNLALGAELTLATATETLRYKVASIFIVDPLNVEPLEPAESTMLTLITCHPFDYHGFAPDRYIVRAEIQP